MSIEVQTSWYSWSNFSAMSSTVSGESWQGWQELGGARSHVGFALSGAPLSPCYDSNAFFANVGYMQSSGPDAGIAPGTDIKGRRLASPTEGNYFTAYLYIGQCRPQLLGRSTDYPGAASHRPAPGLLLLMAPSNEDVCDHLGLLRWNWKAEVKLQRKVWEG